MSKLQHYGVKGMKWGVKRTYSHDVYRKGKKIRSKGDPYDAPYIDGHGVRTRIGNKSKNPTSILETKRVYARNIYRKGKKVHSKGDPYDGPNVLRPGVKTKISIVKAQKRGKSFVEDRLEEKTLVKDMMKNYDKNDPDREEAMRILEEIERDLD